VVDIVVIDYLKY